MHTAALPLKSDTTESRRQPDLTPRDWLDAGQSLLKRGGLKALKLRPLSAELKVSTGSFYHHFPDFDAYQGQLAAYFAEAQIDDLIAAIARAERDPMGRIRLLSNIVSRHRLSRLALAMRAWADSDPRARDAVERHDSSVLEFLTQCLEGLGFVRHEAALRSYAMIAIGLGSIHAPHLKTDNFTDDMLRILCAPPPR